MSVAKNVAKKWLSFAALFGKIIFRKQYFVIAGEIKVRASLRKPFAF